VNHRHSKYDLANSWNYLRLAYQAMSQDPESAHTAVLALGRDLPTVEERLRALSELVVHKARTLRAEGER
jgi:hypothetical protein